MSENTSSAGERLAKVIARAGICSRRDAEGYITSGRVAVNGSVVKTPAFNVIDADTIAVDGKPIARKQATQLWLYHKPAGLMVTEKDPEGRPTVFETFEQMDLPRVLTVGRLDFNTEGLLLLTNDGGLKRTLELPATGWVRRYRVRAFGTITQDRLDTLAQGITVEGVDYGPIEAELDSATGSNVWLTVGLREGKNREVRNVLGALGLEVNRLIRLSYGPFQLGDLPAGHVEKVKTRILKDQLGKRLADSAGADFDSPVDEDATQPRRRAPQKPESRPTERDRYTGLRKRPDFKRPERREAAPRVVHFDDGRPSETFIPRGDPKRRGDADDRPARREGGFKPQGDRPARPGGFKKRFEGDDRPRREGGFKPRGDRPARPGGFQKRFEGDDRPARREGGFKPHGDRPARPGGFKKRFEGEDRPARREGGFKPRDDRPARRPADGGRPDTRRSFGNKPFNAESRGGDTGRPYRTRPEGEGRPFRKDEGRPLARRTGPNKGDKAFGDRPPRRDGDKPFAKGPRRDRAEGGFSDRPARPGGGDRRPPRGPGPDRGKPSGNGKPRRDFGDKPSGRGPAERGDRRPPRPGRPRRDGDK